VAGYLAGIGYYWISGTSLPFGCRLTQVDLEKRPVNEPAAAAAVFVNICTALWFLETRCWWQYRQTRPE